MKLYFCVGTYTEPILFGTGELVQGRGRGLYLCAYEDGEFEILQLAQLVNPSFLCIDEARRKIYAVGEAKQWRGRFGGSVSELSYDARGNIRVESTFGTGGTDPCHIALSPDGRLLCVANFASGSMTAFPIDAEGHIAGEGRLFQHEGSGPDPKRQSGPHAHSVVFSGGGRLYVPDLGLDRIVGYRFSDGEVWSEPALSAACLPGSGPRYGEFSPDGRHFYAVNELASSVTHFLCEDGKLTMRETVCALPGDWRGESTCADLHLTPDGRHLYASNRGHDSIAAFAVGRDGELSLRGHCPSGGRTPRAFQIDPSGRYALICNQDGDAIRVCSIGADGGLTPERDIPFPMPVCVRFFRNFPGGPAA